MKKSKYVIIGNSSAAVSCIESIRRHDKDATISIISDEEVRAYSRPLISYMLAGDANEYKMWYRGDDFYKNNKVDAILGKAVKGINTKERYVTLSSGESLGFEKLLIATGGRPFIPKIKGVDAKRVFTFTKLSDAEKLIQIKDTIKEVVVIGAGMIGTKAAEGMSKLNKIVNIVELGDSVLPRALDKDAAKFVQKRMEDKGAKVFLKNEVVEIVSDKNTVTHVVLKDNTKIPCDTVIIAIGVIPNIDLLKDSGIAVNKGILVNNNMETNIQGIYAAGDVAEASDSIWGDKRLTPIWPLAVRQGRIAGVNMADKECEYDAGYAMNAIEFSGVSTISMGITDAPADAGYEVIKKIDADKGVYIKILLKGNIVRGAILIGANETAGIINTLIREKINIGDIKNELTQDSFGYISFPREFRRDRLERVV